MCSCQDKLQRKTAHFRSPFVALKSRVLKLPIVLSHSGEARPLRYKYNKFLASSVEAPTSSLKMFTFVMRFHLAFPLSSYPLKPNPAMLLTASAEKKTPIYYSFALMLTRATGRHFEHVLFKNSPFCSCVLTGSYLAYE